MHARFRHSAGKPGGPVWLGWLSWIGWIGWLGNLAYGLSALIITLIAAFICWEVFSRYFLGTSSIWVTEISGYLLAGGLFLGMGKTYRHNGHVRMSVMLEKAKPHHARQLYWVGDAVVALFAAILLWQTGQLAMDAYAFEWKSSTLLEVRLFLPQSLMATGALVFFLEVLHTASLRTLENPGNGQGE